jgi:hypothetical protein
MLDHLIVHIGGHKTGSSSIQLTLLSNRKALGDAGVLYPDVGMVQQGHHLVCEWLGAPNHHVDNLARLESLSGEQSTVVLSSENFSKLDGRAIAALKRAVPARRVTIACYVRSPITTIPGWWQELVKHGSSQTLIEFYCDCITRPLQHHIMDPAGMLDAWAEVFGADSVVPFIYERCGDLPAHFFGTFLPDVRYETVPAARSLNKRLSLGANEVMRVGNLYGKRFVKSLRSPEVQAIIRMVENESTGSIRRMPLAMDDCGFVWLENRLAKRWGPRLGLEAGDKVFPERSGTLDYIDGDLYLRSPDLAKSLTMFCESFRDS